VAEEFPLATLSSGIKLMQQSPSDKAGDKVAKKFQL